MECFQFVVPCSSFLPLNLTVCWWPQGATFSLYKSELNFHKKKRCFSLSDHLVKVRGQDMSKISVFIVHYRVLDCTEIIQPFHVQDKY